MRRTTRIVFYGFFSSVFLIACAMSESFDPVSVPILEFDKKYWASFTAVENGQYIIAIAFKTTPENRGRLICQFAADGNLGTSGCNREIPVVRASYKIRDENGSVVKQLEDGLLPGAFYGTGYAGARVDYRQSNPGDTYSVEISIKSKDVSVLDASPKLVVWSPPKH